MQRLEARASHEVKRRGASSVGPSQLILPPEEAWIHALELRGSGSLVRGIGTEFPTRRSSVALFSFPSDPRTLFHTLSPFAGSEQGVVVGDGSVFLLGHD